MKQDKVTVTKMTRGESENCYSNEFIRVFKWVWMCVPRNVSNCMWTELDHRVSPVRKMKVAIPIGPTSHDANASLVAVALIINCDWVLNVVCNQNYRFIVYLFRVCLYLLWGQFVKVKWAKLLSIIYFFLEENLLYCLMFTLSFSFLLFRFVFVFVFVGLIVNWIKGPGKVSI